MPSFSGTRFHEVFASLPDETRDAIKAKAQWEHRSLSSVMHEWWPELWKLVARPERGQD